MSHMLEKGLIQIYTGDGKGKTTAAFGLALRAAGHGGKALIYQFLKPESLELGERNVLESHCEGIVVKWLDEPLQGDAETIKRAEALKPLVDEWIKLVVSTGREREPGQMERLLGDLGPMPEAESPDDRALWVSALINPLPALGVALEIRPAALSASSALERVEVAQTGLLDSIERLKRPGPTF